MVETLSLPHYDLYNTVPYEDQVLKQSLYQCMRERL